MSIVPRPKVPGAEPFRDAGPIMLSRTLENVAQPVGATTATFKMLPGQWEISLAAKPALHSPDNSYNAVVQLECLDADGKTVERFTVAEDFGEHERKKLSKRIEAPKGTASARFQLQLNKTYGTFSVKDLSAVFIAPPSRKDDRISRVLFSTAQLGNLLFPDDPRRVGIEVQTTKPLDEMQRTVSCVVRDYWGAEQMQPARVALGEPEKKGDRLRFHLET